VGIGTTSPNARLHIQDGSNGGTVQLGSTTVDSGTSTINLYGITNNINFRHRNLGTSLASIAGLPGNFGTDSSGYLTFSTQTSGGTLTERMRIDSSGNLLVAQTAQTGAEKFGVTQSATGSNAARFYASSTSYVNNIVEISCARSGATTEYNAFVVFDNNTTAKMLIRPNGNLLNANNSYGSLSDVSLKENIVDATPKLNGLMQVKVRNYNLKDDVNKTKQIGVIAQELETVFPSMIETDADGIKAVKYSVFVPMLIKAIQEQQATINALTARIVALEAK
jgi:hypothetical protein